MAAASSPTEEGPQIVIPDFEIESLARCLLPKIQAYFASPEGKRLLRNGSASVLIRKKWTMDTRSAKQ